MATEFELKYASSASQLDAIRATVPGEYEEISMETTYYDTPGHDLSARKWTLRRRLENGISVCTLKTPAGGLGRHEWELECDSIEAAIPELCKLYNLSDLAELTAGGVIPVCGARFTRMACRIVLDGAEGELALDEGILFGGGRETPLAEVEAELKSGSEAIMTHWAEELACRFGLTPETKSKFRRALDLAKGD